MRNDARGVVDVEACFAVDGDYLMPMPSATNCVVICQRFCHRHPKSLTSAHSSALRRSCAPCFLPPSADPGEVDFVKKGGSFMCHKDFCYRWVPCMPCRIVSIWMDRWASRHAALVASTACTCPR